MPPATKRKRVEITPVLKKALCEYHNKHPTSTRQQIADYIQAELKVNIGLMTITDILKEKEKWLQLSVTPNQGTRQRPPAFEALDQALLILFTNMRKRGATLTDGVLIEKARQLGGELNVDSLKYSVGWLQKFKQRHSIKSYKKHGESADVPLENVHDGRLKLQEALQDYNPDDVYNIDESGFYFSMDPNTTLAFNKTYGISKCKARLTAAFCVNASGTDKRKPLVIWKHIKPRCFGSQFNPSSLVQWYANKKSWMTAVIFNDWLQHFDRSMKHHGRHVALVLDNAYSHKVMCDLSNTKLFFLPRNMTSSLQPLDAGIIRNVKALYRKRQIQHYIRLLEIGRDSADLKITIKEAIYLLSESWK
jgi:hypothetical protein